MDRRLLLASGAYIDLSEYLLKSEAETLYAPLDAILNKQDKLISGTNIKTINGNSLLGGGDITISGSGSDYLPLTGGTITGDLTLTGGNGGAGNFNAFTVGANEVSGYRFLFYNSNYCLEGSNSDLQYCDPNTDSVLTLTWKGDGTKFLSDDGTYKTISGGSSNGGSAAYPEVDGEEYRDKEHILPDYSVYAMQPNKFYVFPECAVLDIQFDPNPPSGIANEYLFQFTSGSEPTTLYLPADIKWTGGETPTIEANKIYQISILKGLASVLEWDNAPTLIENKATLIDSTITFQYPVASELTIKVGMETVTMSAGEKSYQIKYPEPGMSIMNISPISDSTYYYIF